MAYITEKDNTNVSDKSANMEILENTYNNDALMMGKSENNDTKVKAGGTAPTRIGSVGIETDGSNKNKVVVKSNPNQKPNDTKKKSKMHAKLPHHPNTNYTRKFQLRLDIWLNLECT